MPALFEQYRPRTWSEVVGQSKAIAQLDTLRRRGGLAGRAYWISGKSGTGKTTIAKLIAAEVADDWNITENFSGRGIRPTEPGSLPATPPNPATLERRGFLRLAIRTASCTPESRCLCREVKPTREPLARRGHGHDALDSVERRAIPRLTPGPRGQRRAS